MHSISPCSNTLKCSVLSCIDLYVPQTEKMRRFICEGREKIIVLTQRKQSMLLFSRRRMLLILLPLPKVHNIWKKTEFSLHWKLPLPLTLPVLFLDSSITYCSIIARALLYRMNTQQLVQRTAIDCSCGY